ncbi:MAG: DUF975 family protein [Clostridiales bacterium]|nr:DUF975 family protein [Clostridiales bacterium]
MNWTREQLKSNAKLMVKKNWILCIVISLLLTMIAGSEGFRFDLNIDSDFGGLISNGSSAPSYGEAIGNQIGSMMSGEAIGFLLGFLPFMFLVTIIFGVALQAFFSNVIRVGGARFYLHNIHSKGTFGDLGFGFQNKYLNVVAVMFMRSLFVFLWTLLFVIPGIIKSYQYRMVPYLLADNPELSYQEALQTSKEMMDGEKWNAFVLDLSFILWDIASAVTLGIAGLIWVNPYRDATNAELYMALSAKSE